MSWVVLICAELFEIAWADGLKYTAGFSRFWPTAGTVVAMVASVVLLGLAVRHVPIGTACAVWTGIGAIGTVLFGIVLFGESASMHRLICVGLIVIGLVGLKLVSA